MGTKLQSKMYLPGYYSLQNLSSNVGHGSWSLRHENKNLKNGQQYEIFLTRPVVEGFLGHDKEQLRQTILKHESIFRHQLNELHRLYGRQKDLMNEIKSSEIFKYQKAAGTSKSTFSSSGFPTEDDRKSWHNSNLPLIDSSYGRPSSSSTCISQSPCNSFGKTQQTSGGPSQSRVRKKDHESSDSRGKKPRRRLFNLERPANEYISDGEEPEGVLMGSGTENYPPNRKIEVTQVRDKTLFNHIGETSGYNKSALISGLRLERSNGLTDLNEPVQTDKVSASTSVLKFGDPSSGDEIESQVEIQVLSANGYKGIWPFAKKFPENPQMGKDGRVSNLNLKNERNQNEWSTNAFKAEQTSSSGGRIGLRDFNKPRESSETEAKIAREPAQIFPSDQNKTEKRIKRTVFGIEISERDMNSSAKALQSDVTMTESYHNWTKPPSSLSQNLISVQGTTSLNTSTHSDRTPNMLQQRVEVIRDRLLVDCNSVPSTPSLKAEVSHQNGVCFRAKDAEEFQACHPSISRGFQNGNSNRSSACEQNIVSFDGLKKQENPKGRLHWLEAVPLCNGNSSKESEGSHQMKIDSLGNYSKQFLNQTDLKKGPSQSPVEDCSSSMRGHDAENGRVEIGGCMSTRKTLALPMFDKPSGVDNGYSVRIGLVKSDMVQDPVSHMRTEQLKEDGLVQEKRLSNANAYLRHEIDLNRCLTEEDTEMMADSETPVIVETVIDGEESVERKCKEPLDSPHEGLIKVAAEALVAISSAQAHDMQDNAAHYRQVHATCCEMDASEDDRLRWFAELISSHEGNLDNENVSEVKGTACDEESFPDVMDFFEHMTLSLVETKVEKSCYVPPNSDNQREEVTLSKRPRRGQSRRGRQRKDFQRDVLPGIASLSRNEVTEDLQLIEGFIRETGGSWQSSLALRNAGKSGRGRGRKYTRTSAPSTTVAAVTQPQIEQPKCDEELQEGLEERSLTCWGKRTRRPPRPRYNSPVPQK